METSTDPPQDGGAALAARTAQVIDIRPTSRDPGWGPISREDFERRLWEIAAPSFRRLSPQPTPQMEARARVLEAMAARELAHPEEPSQRRGQRGHLRLIPCGGR